MIPQTPSEKKMRLLALVKGKVVGSTQINLEEQAEYTWPWLVYIELIAMVVVLAFLWFVSIKFNGPLEELANPNITPNPSRAPWYFLGLQELLVYFDPWIAGVVLPMFIIIGLIIIPYCDPSVEHPGGGYKFKHRKLGVTVFTIGIMMWFGLIFVGQFVRGPSWQAYPPNQWFNSHKLPLNSADTPTGSLTIVNLDPFAVTTQIGQGVGPQQAPFLPFLNVLGPIKPFLGLLLLGGYFLLGLALPALLARDWFHKIGPIRYGIITILLLIMASVPLKIVARLVFNIKYIFSIPDWNLNI